MYVGAVTRARLVPSNGLRETAPIVTTGGTVTTVEVWEILVLVPITVATVVVTTWGMAAPVGPTNECLITGCGDGVVLTREGASEEAATVYAAMGGCVKRTWVSAGWRGTGERNG